LHFVLIFSVTLLIAVLFSALAERSVLSTAVIFLAAGLLAGPAGMGWLRLYPGEHGVEILVNLAMFTVLFTDGMGVHLGRLIRGWRLPGRALFIGLPLTFLLTGLAARWLLHLPWTECFLLGAVLSPTDPVLASAIIGNEEVPRRVRGLLNVESGMNDGLALPLVVVLLAVDRLQPVQGWHVVFEVAVGGLLGIAIPWLAVRLEALPWFAASAPYQPLNTFAVGLIVLSLAQLIGVNLFLAGFAAGITLGAVGPDFRDAFAPLGELIAELFKLAALLVVGALLPLSVFLHTPLLQWIFVLLVLLVVRTVAIEFSLLGSALDWRERVTVAWFGPKGFASILFGMLILREGTQHAILLFHLVALVVAASVIAHSSTDVVFARWFGRREEQKESESQRAA
jgi:NhaP-type Na+/H+ or K+/H+ antiporter